MRPLFRVRAMADPGISLEDSNRGCLQHCSAVSRGPVSLPSVRNRPPASGDSGTIAACSSVSEPEPSARHS